MAGLRWALLLALVTCGPQTAVRDRGATTTRRQCPTGTGSAAMDAEQAATCLYDAWKDGDRSAAATVASLDVVDELFRGRWSPPEGTLRSCGEEPSTGSTLCVYQHHGSALTFDVRRSEGGWRVTGVRPHP